VNSPAPVPATPAPITAGAIPWWQSTDQKLKLAAGVAIVVAAFPKAPIVAKFGLNNPDQVTNYVNAAAFLAPFAFLAWGFIARFFSKIQPLTWSTSTALEHPATIAAARTQDAMDRAGIPASTVTQAGIEAGRAATHAGADSLNTISPEVVNVIASAVVAEIARQQALYKASHPLPLLAPSGTIPPIPPTAIYPNPTPGATPHAFSPTTPAAT
jgi:hypothetical protein